MKNAFYLTIIYNIIQQTSTTGPVDWKGTGVDTTKFVDSPQLYKHEFKYSIPIVTKSWRNQLNVCTRYTTEVSCRTNTKCGWCTVGTCHEARYYNMQSVCARPYTFRLGLDSGMYQRLGTNIKGVNQIGNNYGTLSRQTYTPYKYTNDYNMLQFNRQEALNKYAFPYNATLPMSPYSKQGVYTQDANLPSRTCEINLNRFDCLNTPNCGWCHSTYRCTSGNEYSASFEFCPNEYWEFALKDNRHHMDFNSGYNNNKSDSNILSNDMTMQQMQNYLYNIQQPVISSSSGYGNNLNYTGNDYAYKGLDQNQYQYNITDANSTNYTHPNQTYYYNQNQNYIYDQPYNNQYYNNNMNIPFKYNPYNSNTSNHIYNQMRFKQSLEDMLQDEGSDTKVDKDIDSEERDVFKIKQEGTENNENNEDNEKRNYYGLDMSHYFKFKQMVNAARKSQKDEYENNLKKTKIEAQKIYEEYMNDNSSNSSNTNPVRMIQRNNTNTENNNNSLLDTIKSYIFNTNAPNSNLHLNQSQQNFVKNSNFNKFRQRSLRLKQSYVNLNNNQKNQVRMEWDPKVISDILSKGEQVAVPRDELQVIMKNLDYQKLGEQVIETLDYQ